MSLFASREPSNKHIGFRSCRSDFSDSGNAVVEKEPSRSSSAIVSKTSHRSRCYEEEGAMSIRLVALFFVVLLTGCSSGTPTQQVEVQQESAVAAGRDACSFLTLDDV